MDLALPIAYNGLTVTNSLVRAAAVPSSGYLFDEVNVSNEDVSAYFDKRANHDGMDAADVYLGRRTVTAIISVYGSTKSDFWTKAQALLAAYSPTLAYNADSANLGFLPFDFYQPTSDISNFPTSSFPNGVPLRFYLRPSAPPTYASQRDSDGGTSVRGLSKQFRVSLVARDPRKYLASTTQSTITTSAQTVSYRGDYPSFPIVTFSISAAGHSAFTLTVGGNAIILNLSSATAATYTLDYGLKTLTDGAGAQRPSLFSSITSFSQVQAGTTFLMANNTAVTFTRLLWREAWA